MSMYKRIIYLIPILSILVSFDYAAAEIGGPPPYADIDQTIDFYSYRFDDKFRFKIDFGTLVGSDDLTYRSEVPLPGYDLVTFHSASYDAWTRADGTRRSASAGVGLSASGFGLMQDYDLYPGVSPGIYDGSQYEIGAKSEWKYYAVLHSFIDVATLFAIGEIKLKIDMNGFATAGSDDLGRAYAAAVVDIDIFQEGYEWDVGDQIYIAEYMDHYDGEVLDSSSEFPKTIDFTYKLHENFDPYLPIFSFRVSANASVQAAALTVVRFPFPDGPFYDQEISGSGTAYAWADPYIYIDPDWEYAEFFEIVVSEGVNNSPAACEDLVTFAAAYGSVASDTNYNAYCDYNNDGDIDGVDLFEFGTTL